jgi:hypothetical protein
MKESLKPLMMSILNTDAFTSKLNIQDIANVLVKSNDGGKILNGDDTAVIPTENGYLLFAAEGIAPFLLEKSPRLAGRSAVLANVNDVYAMGGRPTALVDVIYSSDNETTDQILLGMKESAARFSIPIVGGHTIKTENQVALSMTILGEAKNLITSFDARPGDKLLLAYNPEGRWLDDFGFWNSLSERSDNDIVSDLEILPQAAERGLVDSGKDVSMAGIIGTSLMLAETSMVGIQIEIDNIPVPKGVEIEKWLTAYFSYGFLLSVRPESVREVSTMFQNRSLTAVTIGEFCNGSEICLTLGSENEIFWDWDKRAYTGFTKP